MKRFCSILLVLALLCALAPFALAAGSEELAAEEALHALGLFEGAAANPDGSPVYELDRQPARHEAVTMLVRLLGADAEAKTGTRETPFTDVDK